MEQEKLKDFFWRTYEKLPEDIKEAIFSENNDEAVKKICARLSLTEEQTSIVAKYVGRSLMGLLPIDDLPVTLELELNIDEQVSNNLVRELNYAIFKHLRVSLTKLYSGEYVPEIPEEVEEEKKDDIIKEEKKEVATKEEKPVEKIKIDYSEVDPYREAL